MESKKRFVKNAIGIPIQKYKMAIAIKTFFKLKAAG
jgi:hypothetical protein